MKSLSKFIHLSRKCIWKCHLENVGHFVSASMCWNNSAYRRLILSLSQCNFFPFIIKNNNATQLVQQILFKYKYFMYSAMPWCCKVHNNFNLIIWQYTNKCVLLLKIQIKFAIKNHKWCNDYINGLVQERCNSIANTLELRLSCTNPSIYVLHQGICQLLILAFHVAKNIGLSE